MVVAAPNLTRREASRIDPPMSSYRSHSVMSNPKSMTAPTRIPPRSDLPSPPRPDVRKRRVEIALVVTIATAIVASTLMSIAERRSQADAEPTRPIEEIRPIPTTPICAETDRLLALTESDPVGASPFVASLDALVPTDVGDPFVPVGDEWIPDAETLGRLRGPVWLAELRADGFERGFIREWRVRKTSASIWVYQFATPQGALAFQRFALEDQSCPYSTDVFQVDGVNGAIGHQILWADGTESDQVAFVRGSRRYLVNVRGPRIPERELVLTLTEQVNATAR
jgi:hypothetical protein